MQGLWMTETPAQALAGRAKSQSIWLEWHWMLRKAYQLFSSRVALKDLQRCREQSLKGFVRSVSPFSIRSRCCLSFKGLWWLWGTFMGPLDATFRRDLRWWFACLFFVLLERHTAHCESCTFFLVFLGYTFRYVSIRFGKASVFEGLPLCLIAKDGLGSWLDLAWSC